jgi:hypothetical protein
LRLPDQSDRELVGKAAGLNNDQIAELSKLQCGVAAVYQNDWIQPVLCKVACFATPEKPYVYKCEEPLAEAQDTVPAELIQEIVLYLLAQNTLDKEQVEELKEKVLRSNIENGLKLRLHSYLATQKPSGNTETITDIIAGLFPLESTALKRYHSGCFPLTMEWADSFYREIEPQISFFNHDVQQMIIKCIIAEYSMNTGLNDLPPQWYELDWRIENGNNQEI